MSNKSLYQRYISKVESIKDPYFKNVKEDLYNGQNSYLRMRMKGSSVFNDEWIKTIEDCVYELGQIVNNPLEVTKTEGELTPIELARKINYESIQHLASHSQYVKDIDENGNVMPAKILAQFHKEELHTYENKFIATFIRRLVLFVEKRYDFIKNTVNFDTKDVMYIKNRSIVDGQEVTIETKVTLKKANEDAQSAAGREFVARIEKMRRYVNYFYNSPFMKELKTEKNVRKPILQTNIIRKNPYYRKCYETFVFIERFSSLGVEYTLDEKYQDFNENERKALNNILASNLLSLEATEQSKVYKKTNKSYKPKLLSSCDDEIFTYGNLVKGPIEFVRVDEKYTEWLNAQVSTKIPPKPNKAEREYFKDEIELKKNTKKHIAEVEQLLKRIRREIAKWEKYFTKLIEERNIKEAKEAEAHLLELRKQERDILDRKRKEIIAAALGEKADIKAKKLEEIKQAEEEAKRKEELMRKAIEEAAAIALAEAKAEEERLLAEEAAKKAEEEQPQEEKQPEEAVTEEVPAEEVQPEPEPQQEEPIEETPVTEESVPVEEQPAQESVLEEPQTAEEPVEELAKKKFGWGGARPGAGRPRKVVEAQPEQEPVEEVLVAEEPTEEQPAIEESKPEEQVIVDTPIEEQPAAKKFGWGGARPGAGRPRKVIESQPEQEPVEVQPAPVEEAPVVEEPIQEPQVEEELAAKKFGWGGARPGAGRPRKLVEAQPEQEPVEETPAVEEQAPVEESVEEVQSEPKPEPEPQQEPEPEQPVEETPVVEEEPAKEKKSPEKTGENAKPTAKKSTEKPAKKPVEKPEPTVEEEEPVREEPTTVFAKIPGRFIVKSNKGYVVSKTEFTNVKSQARVFDDFNDARRYKAMFGGKVIKL